MRKYLLIVFTFLLVSPVFAQWEAWDDSVCSSLSEADWQKPQDNSIPKKYPEYLLVLRYWDSSPTKRYGIIASVIEWNWIYLYETYGSLDAVLKRLNTYTGQGLKDMNELVGLWRLGEDKNIINQVVELETTKHCQPETVYVKERKWESSKWKRKNP